MWQNAASQFLVNFPAIFNQFSFNFPSILSQFQSIFGKFSVTFQIIHCVALLFELVVVLMHSREKLDQHLLEVNRIFAFMPYTTPPGHGAQIWKIALKFPRWSHWLSLKRTFQQIKHEFLYYFSRPKAI